MCVSGESAVRAVVPGGGHAAVDDAVYTRTSPQLALLRRYPVLLHPADTALRTTSRQFVLNPDVLTPGRKYFAKVTAFHKRTTWYNCYHAVCSDIKLIFACDCAMYGTNVWQCTNTVVDVDTVCLFKARLDKFWMHQVVKYDFMADLTGTGDRSVHDISVL